MLKVGIVLSGCGYLDGSEIQEAVLAAYFLEREGAELLWCAPDITQMHVFDHRTGKRVDDETRNVLTESARIARGDVVPVESVDVSELDALVLPGGFGVAKNLSTFSIEGPNCQVHPGVFELVRAVHAAEIPIGAICIAPAIIARVLGDGEPRLTIGNDPATLEAIKTSGAIHEERAVDEICVDAERRIVSTPAYMLGPRISDVAKGIEALCREVMAMARSKAPQPIR